MEVRFDILREDDEGEYIWLEAVNSLEVAATRIDELSKRMTGRFVVFDQRLQATVPVPAPHRAVAVAAVGLS
jgi:hypothetical protein